MRKLRIALLAVFLAGCSSRQNILPTAPLSITQTPSPVSTKTAAPLTQTLTPAARLTPTITSTALGGGAGKIAFVSERDGYPEIYVIEADGSHLIKLANEISPKFYPAWSPDRKKIAFGSTTNVAASIYIMNADGSNPTKLIDTKELSPYDQAPRDWRFVTGCCSPVWSPDGAKIAFSIVHYVGCCMLYSSIYIINADGSHLISVSDHSTEYFGQSWSPDSQKIAFGGDCPGPGVCVMNADGTNLINLTQNKGGGGPNWSPDGKKIMFATGWGGNAKVYVMNADGTNPVDLTHNGSPWDHEPVWSPDGRKISFTSYRDGNYEIYVMNDDGTDLVNLTNNPADDGGTVWSPDSTKIAFVSERDGNSEIYVMNADGSGLLRLTNNDASDYSPVWSP